MTPFPRHLLSKIKWGYGSVTYIAVSMENNINIVAYAQSISWLMQE